MDTRETLRALLAKDTLSHILAVLADLCDDRVVAIAKDNPDDGDSLKAARHNAFAVLKCWHSVIDFTWRTS